LRIIIYGIVLLIIYGLLNSIANTKLEENQNTCQSKVERKLQGLEFAQSMSQCMKETNGFLERLFTASNYDSIISFPNNPKEYVGAWASKQPNCYYKINFYQDAMFLAEAIECDISSSNFEGKWSVHEDSMLWITDRGRIWPPDVNSIEHKNENEFVLTELNGKKTHFTRYNFEREKRLTVNEKRKKQVADLKGAQAKKVEQKRQAILNQVFPVIHQENNLPPMLPGGWPLSIEGSGQTLWIDYNGANGKRLYHVLEWNPATGERKRLDLDPSYIPNKTASVDNGYFFWQSNPFIHPARNVKKEIAKAGNISLFTKEGNYLSAQLKVARFFPELLTLSDQSILLVGGYTSRKRGKIVRINAVERVSLVNGQLQVEQLTDIPGDIRTGYSLVALPDQRAMLLGGTSGSFIGCSPCIADTYIFDLKSRQWHKGPDMLEGRSDANARLMPDGRVLVSGGWTPTQEWQNGASRTTEWWSERENRFTSGKKMVAASAMHQTSWLPGFEQKILVLASGNSAHVQGYMVNEDRWIALGDGFSGFEKGDSKFSTPVSYENKQYIWNGRFSSSCNKNEVGFCIVKLRLPFESDISQLSKNLSSSEAQNPIEIKYHRNGISFLPTQGEQPAWVLGGGSFLSHRNPYLSASDQLWSDGRIKSGMPFNHARMEAQALRMDDGAILLAGGRGEKCREVNRSCAILPFEYLPKSNDLFSASWLTIPNNLSQESVFTSYIDNSILVFENYKGVTQLTLEGIESGKPSFSRGFLGALNNGRTQYNSSKVSVKGLTDGRIIVAGGAEQINKVALLKLETIDSEIADEYIGIGSHTPSVHYETYHPKQRRWIQSSPSIAGSEVAAIFDDGRVVKLGTIYSDKGRYPADGSEAVIEKQIVEISSVDGESWNQLPLPNVGLSNEVKLIVQQQELFVIGHFDTGKNKYGEMMVQWFNSEVSKWETIWMADKSKRGRHQTGLIISQKLDNGKQVMFPVGVR